MFDSGKVIIGLVAFLILFTFPMWYNFATGEAGAENVPQLEKAVKGNACVEDTEYMRSFHMDLLNQWRDDVVRDGKRVYTAKDGKKYNMSLSHTCLDCHASKKNFCEKCHTYLKVTPYCWDCHTVPEEVAK